MSLDQQSEMLYSLFLLYVQVEANNEDEDADYPLYIMFF